MTPNEIVVGPMDVYLAPESEAQPTDAGTSPAGNWALLGTNGDDDYDEAGITVDHSQTIQKFFTLGSTGAKKVSRTQESLMIAMTLLDLLPAEVSKAWNGLTVTDAGDFDWMGLRKGITVQTRAVWAVGASISPAGAFNIAWYLRKSYNQANHSIAFNKGAMAAVRCEWDALEDLTASTAAERFGRLIVDEA